MVIAKLQGGLGNQMFQYAFGRSVAIKNNCDLKLDLSFFETQNLRKYGLNHFSIIEDIATAGECDDLKQRHVSQSKSFRARFIKPRPYLVEEKSLVYDPYYIKIGDNTYLSGYWQSEKYFNHISKQIRDEFKVKTVPSAANRKLLTEIELNNAVSVHIRRGDFEIDATVNKIHGTCSLNYYKDAANMIAAKVVHPVFYVFSDNIPWARKYLNLNYATRFVDINDENTAFEDLRLMHHCKHHILANSTFSWWGAWLNPNRDKIIIAPKRWFNATELNLQAESIIPVSWIRI